MDKEDGGAAFPTCIAKDTSGGTWEGAIGMSLRDYFATHCPESYLKTDHFTQKQACEFLGETSYDRRRDLVRVICKLQYEYADAMLKERTK